MIPERRAAWILGGFAVAEGSWIVLNAWDNERPFLRYLGFATGRAGEGPGWLAAVVVTVLFVGYARRLPSVREHFLRPSFLKALALAVAVAAGILEEAIFRKMLMDVLLRHGCGPLLQVIGTALAFGAAHAIWGLMGKSPRAAIGAMLATGALGGMLGVVYLLGGRSLAPCIVSHFFINALIEPGLVLAALRGEMARRRA